MLTINQDLTDIPPVRMCMALSLVTGRKTIVMVASQNGTKLGGIWRLPPYLFLIHISMIRFLTMMATDNLINQCQMTRAMLLSLLSRRTIVMIIQIFVTERHMQDLRFGVGNAISAAFSSLR